MKVLGLLLRLFSYLFHLLLSLFLLGIAILATTSHQSLNLGMLPFEKEHVLRGVYTLHIIGLLSTLLAITRLFKYLFPVWAAVVLYILVRGFIFSSYSFPNTGALRSALWLILAALAAFIGALWTLKPRRGRLYY